MVEPSLFKSQNFEEIFAELEESFLDELEHMAFSQLVEKKSVELSDTTNEVVEYAGRTNYKIRLKRPHKNVWSISFQDLRESIRKVLREGKLVSLNGQGDKQAEQGKKFDLPTLMLLHVLPDEEYLNRSFVGNKVDHPTMGEGRVIRISDTGNVEVKFADRVAKLKPGFVKLKTE